MSNDLKLILGCGLGAGVFALLVWFAKDYMTSHYFIMGWFAVLGCGAYFLVRHLQKNNDSSS